MLIVLTTLSCLVSLAAIVITGLFYWKFSQKQEMSRERISNQISGILTEFNTVSNENLELLEDRTEELRRVVDLADLKTKKLNRLIDHAEGVKKFLKKELDKRGTEESEESQSHREQILSLAEDGYDVSQIAEKTGIKPGEVSVIIRLNKSRLSGTKASQST